MVCCRARWVLPISVPPIPDGWITIDNGRIVARGGRDPVSVDGGEAVLDLGDVAVLPGLVNAHTHLELSYLRGRVPSSASLVSWVRALMAERRASPDSAAPEILRGVHDGITEAMASGTAVVGDITNSLITAQDLSKSGLAGMIFHELIGFSPADPAAMVERACQAVVDLKLADGLRSTLAAHAPYSVAPSIFRMMPPAIRRRGLSGCSVHLAESAEEMQFIRSGEGPWRQLLEDFGVWNAEWTAPGVSPVEYLDEQGFLNAQVLVVHGVHMSGADLTTLRARGTTLVTCPRSNRHTGAGVPPIDRFYESGVAVAVGTDSLASTPDLNLFSELADMHALAPALPPSTLLESATAVGARALGVADHGTIEPGQRARLIAVAVPRGVDDVEEYLVSGIEPAQVQWVKVE